MKLLNYNYIDLDSLKLFIETNDVPDSNRVLIQIFYSNTDMNKIYKLREALIEMLPKASLVATSTAGIISEGYIIDDAVIISFSIFKASSTKSVSYCSLKPDKVLESLSKDLINDKTKLIVFFANTFKFDSELLLKKITKKYPNIAIAGGNAGDDFRFEKCEIFSHSCIECDVVFAAIDSDVLQVETKYLLNWHTIGKDLTVTKADGTRLYEINNKKVIDIYEYYLGKEMVENILLHGTEFPLVYQEDGINVARAPIIVHDDGSLTLAGKLSEGTKVKFGYADIEYIDKYNKQMLIEEYEYKNEAIYIYSCSARRTMMNTYLNEEISIINNIAPTSGFVTYGEFFHDNKSCTNNLLNITTTYVVLNEGERTKEKIYNNLDNINQAPKDVTLKALTTLVSRTSEELDESIYYLEQFRDIVNKASILSITDGKGIIRDVNKNFEIISGFNKEELIGKPHNIVRHEDTLSEVFRDMWNTIQNGKMWSGLIKNKTKKGDPYYVISQISPIYDKQGYLREYISIRNDVTEIEEYKHILKNELDHTSKCLKENLNYTAQYENAINSTTAILKTDINNIIKYANEKFCELSEYKLEELIGRNCEELRHSKHREAKKCSQIIEQLKNKKIVHEILTNITKNSKEFIVNNLFYPIVDLNKNVVEYLQIMHDITEIVHLNEEITNTQKEVVLTMGAIGETRSKETGLHVQRVAEYSYLLAKLVGLSEDEASLLKQASPMHDIGKVGIPDSILNKPGKLTPEEFDKMKTHSDIGYEMLKYSNRPILKASALVAKTHHEKWDGTGYPNCLKGEDIPIFGRITAVADVFDALGHDRCYKKAWELDEILNLFKKESGKHFDPNLVNLFFKNLDKFLTIRDMYNDRHIY